MQVSEEREARKGSEEREARKGSEERHAEPYGLGMQALATYLNCCVCKAG